MKTINALLAFAAALATMGGALASAHAQMPARIRATIETVSGDTLQLKTREGGSATVVLAPDAKVVGVSKADLSAIKPGSFVGAAAFPQRDGTLKALEVHVFPPSMKGTGEGHNAWDLGAESTMTNGTVGDLVGSDGRTITVKYHGGEKTITVPETAPVVQLEVADRSLLVQGAHVVIAPAKAADGTLTAGRVNVGVNGVVPPM